MSHLEPKEKVTATLVSDDADLLDAIGAELPAEGDGEVGAEYAVRRRTHGSGGEIFSIRVTLEDDGGVDAATHAADLYAALTGYDLDGRADRHEVRHFRAPVGAVSTSAVEQYYEENPGEQPVDEDGEAYVPESWTPSNHVVDETHS